MNDKIEMLLFRILKTIDVTASLYSMPNDHKKVKHKHKEVCERECY